MNQVVLIGRLTKDPELRYLPNANNTAITRFTLAVDKQLSKEKRAEYESNNRLTADFINCVVWGKQAENIAQYVSKGNQLAVRGRIQTGSYDGDDGIKRYTTYVVVNEFTFVGGKKQTTPDESSGFYEVDDSNIPF